MAVRIDKDHIAEPGEESRAGFQFNTMPTYAIERIIGVSTEMLPGGLDGIAPIPFRMYDDDGELYYEGQLSDDPDCENQSAALRWGEADAGCTTIKVLRNGEWVQEIG